MISAAFDAMSFSQKAWLFFWSLALLLGVLGTINALWDRRRQVSAAHLATRPRNVVYAVALLCLDFALSSVTFWEFSFPQNPTYPVYAIVLQLLTLWGVWLIWRGRKWIALLCVVAVLISLGMTIFDHLGAQVAQTGMEAYLDGWSSCLGTISIWLLCSRASREWFLHARPARAVPPAEGSGASSRPLTDA